MINKILAIIQLKKNCQLRWRYTRSIDFDLRVKGHVFFKNRFLTDRDLSSIFSQLVSNDNIYILTHAFSSFLKKLNGNFSVILKTDRFLFAAVDTIRSIPLFYSMNSHFITVTDFANYNGDEQEIDQLSLTEFCLTGYVTGEQTLLTDIKQIQAGRFILIDLYNPETSIHQHRYYQYFHAYDYGADTSTLLQELDAAVLNSFSRLIQIADGATIVVPLSGGHDSRLVVTMLKRLKYDNVIAFSYGRPGNREASVSKNVADALGIRWEFIPYSRALWRQWYNSKEWSDYWQYSHDYSSLPHLQDWPAVKVLKENDILTHNAIFVPGHSADLPAGSRSVSLPQLYTTHPLEPKTLLDSIFSYHYSLFDWNKKNDELHSTLTKRIINSIGDLSIFPDNASAFESWDFAERQAKFIINSIRVYEYWGFRWALPLWDTEFIKFWSRVSIEHRINTALYRLYVDSLFNSIQQAKFHKHGQSEAYLYNIINKPYNELFSYIKSRIRHSTNSHKYKLIYNKYRYYSQYFYCPMCWHGIVDIHEYATTRPMPLNINSWLIQLYLKKFDFIHIHLNHSQ